MCKKTVTAVLPARNCRQDLNKCLKALTAGEYVPEIIVVDDGSKDGTGEMVRRDWPSAVVLTLGAHTGYAHAANSGLRLVRTEYALLLRPDLQPSRRCVKRLLDAVSGEPAGADGPGIFCAVPQVITDPETYCNHQKTIRKDIPKTISKTISKTSSKTIPKTSRETIHGNNRKGTGCKTAVRNRRIGSHSFIKPASSLPPACGRQAGCSSRPEPTLAVPDGCALYRMEVLERIGWLDERHYDGLEAFDLSMRAALYGFDTVRVLGAYVRPADGRGRGQDQARETLRGKLAAGNSLFTFYKNMPRLQRILAFPLVAAVRRTQEAALLHRSGKDGWKEGRGKGGNEDWKENWKEEHRMAIERGRMLCTLEKERREAFEQGAGSWPENLSEASYLAMGKEAGRIYPLFLAYREPASPDRIPRYLRISRLLFRDYVRDYLLFDNKV